MLPNCSDEMILKTVYALSTQKDSVRAADAAAWLRISRSLVSLRMKNLTEEGLVLKNSRNELSLSGEAYSRIADFISRFETVRVIFSGLGPEDETMLRDAFVTADCLSSRLLSALEAQFGPAGHSPEQKQCLTESLSPAPASPAPVPPDDSPGGAPGTSSGRTDRNDISPHRLTREILAQEAMDYVLEHYREKFSLDAIADHLHINKNYLSRIFRKATGSTLLTFHNRVRIRNACRLLEDRSLSITRIAGLTGFASSAHFSRIFQKATGLTPTAYRKQLSSEEALIKSTLP